jgi:altronate hydrolase
LKKSSLIQIHPTDNVLVALQDVEALSVVEFNEMQLVVQERIPAKHKVYLRNLFLGSEVYMYGVLVGKTTCNVKMGQIVTIDNLKHAAQQYSIRNYNYQWKSPDISHWQNKTFKGYHRSDGCVGTANYWLFIPTVFCENRNLDVIKEALYNELGYAVTDKYKSFTKALLQAYREGKPLTDTPDFSASAKTPRVFENIDGIKFLNHTGGCGGTRQDAATLQNLLAAYADHPNVGGITILSLGCQHLQLDELLTAIKQRNPTFDKPVFSFEQQAGLSEEEIVKQAIVSTFNGLIELNELKRSPADLSHLTIGVKCGGSDGFSGISANPAVGHCADLLVALGGKVLLAEFPELCGAEQELIDRSVNQPTAEKFIRLMEEYNAQAMQVGSGFHMNPSPGNIKDGLITDAIKSAGACKKGGSSPVVDVLDYTEKATKPGLSLVCTPGNDVEATTGKAASGATLILFTTGLGTPTGNPVCPTIKLATNTALAKRMPDIIDIDCGGIITGEKTIEEMGEEILEYCIKAASGEVVPKAVQLNQDDFIPWKRGVSL